MRNEERTTAMSPGIARRAALGVVVGGAASALALGAGGTAAHAATTLTSVGSFAALAALPITSPMEPVVVLGRAAIGDGGEGVFIWDAAAAASSADGGTRLASTASATGVWRRQTDGDDRMSARWFGVKADGSADDTTAFQSAVNAAVRAGAVLMAPAGTIRITSSVTVPAVGTSRRLFIQGAGQVQTRFRLSASGRFDFDLGVSSEWDNGHLILRDFSVLCDSAETITAVTARFARVSGATAQTSIIENVEVVGVSDTTGPKVAFHLVDASALRFRGARIQGRRSGGGSDTVGVLLSGGSIPVEIYLSEINVYFMNTAFLVDGTADRRLEGVHLDKCAAVACAYGVTANAAPTDQSLWIKVSQSHFNCTKGGISTSNYGNILFTGNLIYGLPAGGASVAFLAVSVSNGGGSGVGHLSMIADNIIEYAGSTTAAKNGILIAGGASEDSILISNNILAFFDTAIWLAPTANRVAIAATNMFKSNTTPTLNQGSNNVVAPALVTW
jgi:hypothetical protein